MNPLFFQHLLKNKCLPLKFNMLAMLDPYLNVLLEKTHIICLIINYFGQRSGFFRKILVHTCGKKRTHQVV